MTNNIDQQMEIAIQNDVNFARADPAGYERVCRLFHQQFLAIVRDIARKMSDSDGIMLLAGVDILNDCIVFDLDKYLELGVDVRAVHIIFMRQLVNNPELLEVVLKDFKEKYKP